MTNPMYVVRPDYAGRGEPAAPVKDFSRPADLIRFRVDDDVFEALPELPALDAILVTDLLNTFDSASITGRDRFDLIVKFVEIVMTTESAERFVARLTSRERPLGFNRLLEIMIWLVNRYRAEIASDEDDAGVEDGDAT